MDFIKQLVFLLLVSIFTSQQGFAAYSVFIDDRVGFDAALTANSSSTIIDDANIFATDPVVASGLAVVPRSGIIIGNTYIYNIYDINFSNSPTGSIFPGVTGDDIVSLTNINVEMPVMQGMATGSGSWGVDASSGSPTSKNAALFDFTTTPGGNGVGHFGVELHDFESHPSFTSGELRLYDGGLLVYTTPIIWPGGANGNNQSHFMGIITDTTTEFFDQVVFVLGDDNMVNNGLRERWAADRMTFGQAYHQRLADLQITKVLDTDAPYQEGDTLQYTITITNNGPDVATNVVITDTPTNLSIVTVSSTNCIALPCTISSLANGASETITVTASIVNGGDFLNDAAVSSDDSDPDISDNSVSSIGGSAIFNQAEKIPTLSFWSLLLLCLLLMFVAKPKTIRVTK